MTNYQNYQEAAKDLMKTLSQYVPVVDRVHGAHHPEFHKVRALFDQIQNKTRLAGKNTPDLKAEFVSLRQVSDNYQVPQDVCESYEAVYQMLQSLDTAYHLEGGQHAAADS